MSYCFRDLGISSAVEVANTLMTMRDSIKTIEAKYEGVVRLNDYGRLVYAPVFRSDKDNGMKQVEGAMEELAQKEKERQQFGTTYKVGRDVLGTVVHVASDYALVQLPEGETGIMHVTAMKASPSDYVQVNEVVHEGDTVLVQILNSDALSKRIELRLVQPEDHKREPRW